MECILLNTRLPAEEEQRMKIIGLDIETTGLKQEAGHRIIEIAMLTYDAESEALLDTFVQRIDPERAIDPMAQKVHGISYEELVGCPKWPEVAPRVADKLNGADLMVVHNLSFDQPFIAGELRRIGIKAPSVPGFCTMRNGRWACFNGKFPKLGELCFALSVAYDKEKAHGAEYDVEVMMQCFFEGVRRNFYKVS
jgi:DNA polymerase-3 subunit epsilon